MYTTLFGELHHNYNPKSQNFQKVCPHCQSTNIKVIETSGPHHAKLICGDCEKFICWLPSPATIEKERKMRERLERLRRLEPKGWNGIFVRDLSHRSAIAHREGKRFKLSPKQLAHLERIESELGGEQ